MSNSRGPRTILTTVRVLAALSLAALAVEAGSFAALRALDWRNVRAMTATRAVLPAYAKEPWADSFWREQMQVLRASYGAYALWRTPEFAGQTINVDARGIRRTHHSDCEDSTTRTIWMFGGSTVWGFGSPDWETVPSRLAEQFSSGGRRACVVNYGEDSWRAETALVKLLLELKRGERRPDAVVFLDGCNDTFTPLFLTGRADRDWNFDLNRRWFDFAAQRSRGSLDYLQGLNSVTLAERISGRFRKSSLPVDRSGLDALARDIAMQHLRNVKALDALAVGYGFSAFSFWQPLGVTGQKRLTAEEDTGIRRQLGMAYEFSQVIGPRVAELVGQGNEPGLRSLTGLFDDVGESVYFDACHLLPSGNRLVAAHIFAALQGGVVPVPRPSH